MRLTEYFLTRNQITANQNAQAESTRLPVGNPSPEEMKLLQSLQPGQIITGQVLAGENGEVSLKLLNDLMVQAKCQGGSTLELGKLLSFQVRSNGTALTLLPLQTNLSPEAPVTRALDQAGLPMNSATAKLTQLMMKAGLPVNKESLQEIYREMVTRTNGDLSDLVDLHRLGMEVTEENLSQMSSYKNLTHQLTEGLAQVTGELLDTVEELARGEESQKGAILLRDVLNLVTEQGSREDPSVNLTAEEGFLRNPVGSGEGLTQQTQIPKEGMLTDDGILQELESPAVGLREPGQILSSKELTITQKLDYIGQILERAIDKQDLQGFREVMTLPESKKLLSELFSRQWSVSPGQVADREEVESLYRRLKQQLSGITHALEQAGQAESAALQSTQQMTQNIDFLSQVNQMYAYVQLPLSFQEAKAQGELYVFTKKKNLAQQDGPISALLHLDMEHLGPVDVYVTMDQGKVDTRFTVQDEEMLDFLEQHMDLLTGRLEKRGYHLKVNMQVRGEEAPDKTSGITPILDSQSPGMLLQTKSFDVRT